MVYISRKLILGALLFVVVLVYWAVGQKENQSAAVIFFNVGQGDSTLIELPGDIQILVDAGPSSNISSKLSQYLPFYDREIELAILTHPHADHLSGFLRALKDYHIKNFILAGANYNSKIYTDFVSALRQEGSSVYWAKAGDTISWGNAPILKILWPDKIALGRNFKSIHDSTVISQLNLGNKKFLLMGDAEVNAETALVASNAITDIDILKVGHHGSKTSTSDALLQASKPEEAIIQVGRNSYGHPAPLVLDRLAKFGVKIFRNDQVGDVVYK